MDQKIWKDYSHNKQTYKQVADKYGYNIKTIQRKIGDIYVFANLPEVNDAVVVADVTFFGRFYGIIVFRDPNRKKNLYWTDVESETAEEYSFGKYWLSKRAVKIKAVVLDGKAGIKEVFKGIPVQMCQFHQVKIVTRYLTRRPKLEASKELRYISLELTKSTEEEFYNKLNNWYNKWELFLKEKTINIETGTWFYTHGRVRSAYNSLIRNRAYLFTYKKYPDLNIPNTTNSLDGSFSHLKDLLNAHRGLRKSRKLKLINEILGNS